MAVYWDVLNSEENMNRQKTNFANQFLSQNRRMYNLAYEAGEPLTGLKHLSHHWEKEIHRGLSCLVNNYTHPSSEGSASLPEEDASLANR